MQLSFNDKVLELKNPVVIGILNLTPDSFFDGGKYLSEKQMLIQAEKMITEGVSIIEVGAVSTRPGSVEISEGEEWSRLKTALKMLLSHFPGTFLSVDTCRSGIAEMSVCEGAVMINDISGGTFDPKMLSTIARLKVPFVIMHIQGTPQNMQLNPRYNNVVEDIKRFFKLQLERLSNLGVTENIILDPGFGFGKTLEHNYQLLRDLRTFKDSGCPLLVGLSRKSMINKVLHTKPEEALNGTTVLNTIALMNGADILRVHDVKEARQAIELFQFYNQAGAG